MSLSGLTSLSSIASLQDGFGGGGLGPDLILNGGFDDTSEWVLSNASVTIAGGEAVFTASPNGSYMFQQNSVNPHDFEVNETYRFVFQVSSYTTGFLRVRIGNLGTLKDASINGIGEFTVDVPAPALFAGSVVQIFAGGTTTLAIDSVEARKV